MKSRYFYSFLLLVIISVSSYGGENRAIELFKTAEKEYRQEHYYTAIEYYKTALQSNPVYVDALYGLAETYLKLNEYNTAEMYIKKAAALDKYSIPLKILEGRIYTALGKYKEAGKNIEEVLLQEPNNRDARTAKAELFIAEGNTINAIEIYDTILKHSPEDRRSLISLILILDDEEQYDKSEEYVEKALRLFPEDSIVQYTAAVHFLREGNRKRVERHASAAVSLNPENKNAVLLLTRLYMEENRYDEAAAQLNFVLKKDRNQPLIWYTLGEIYRKNSKKNEALRSYSIAVNLAPEDELLRMALEDFIVENTEPGNPVRGKYAEYHLKAGKGYEELNYLDNAKFEYRRALYIDPHSEKSWLMYADLLKTEGFKAKYLSILKEVAGKGNPGTDILDKIEIYESLLQDSVSSRWGVNQFEIEKPMFRIMLFGNGKDNSGYYIIKYLKKILNGNERIEVQDNPDINTFSQAFNNARKNGSDYFVSIISGSEENTFRIDVKVYTGSTGTLVKEFTVFRTGNRRVSGAMLLVSRIIEELVPLKGRIIKRNFNKVLLDIGSAEGVEKNSVFYITKPGKKLVIDENFNYKISMDDVVGEVTVDDIDDLVSEGILKNYKFFDLIAPGDLVFVKNTKEKTGTDAIKQPEGNNTPSKLYKTILTIP